MIKYYNTSTLTNAHKLYTYHVHLFVRNVPALTRLPWVFLGMRFNGVILAPWGGDIEQPQQLVATGCQLASVWTKGHAKGCIHLILVIVAQVAAAKLRRDGIPEVNWVCLHCSHGSRANVYFGFEPNRTEWSFGMDLGKQGRYGGGRVQVHHSSRDQWRSPGSVKM